jgi:tRNA(Ile)-lysidine synthase
MFLSKVEETIQKYALLAPGDQVLIAYSGGPDSTALMLALLDLRQKWDLGLTLAHFNHRLRRSADRDERFVRRAAENHSLPLVVGSEDVRLYAAENRLNVEEAGRKLRYRFLRESARGVGKTKIATGHTLDDQAETFLMRLLRGSGLQGLSGIYPLVDGLIIRPLLRVERKDVEAYLRTKKAAFVIDSSNADRRFLRNRIRHELVPFFQNEFDPSIVSRIGKITSILQEDEAVLNRIAKAEAGKAIQKRDGLLCLDWKFLSSLSRGLARRVVREYICALRGDLRRISFDDIEALLSLETGKECQLKKDLLLRREKNWIFNKSQSVAEKPDFELLWSGESPLAIPSLNMRLKGNRLVSVPENVVYDDRKMAILDWNSLRFPLTVRTRREGDRYHPFGAPGSQKLKEMMRAKNIPTHQRERLPVVLSAGKIVWATGLPVSDLFKVTPQTEDVFMISVESEPVPQLRPNN